MRTRSSFERTARPTLAGVLLAAAAAGLLSTSCDPLDCGEGTSRVGDQCVPTNPVEGSDAGVHCGAGTILVGNECVPNEDLCGEFTSPQPVLDDAGVPTGGFVCVGQATGENPPPDCPEENPPGTICINGYVRWFLDDAGNLLDTIVADPEASESASVLQLLVYDPLQYATNPNVAPLAVAPVNAKTGTFKVEGVAVPATGFIALVVDDSPNAAADVYTFAGIPFEAGAQNMLGVTAVAITNQQVDDWTEALGGDSALAALGCPDPGGGRTLFTCGTWIGVFAEGTQAEPGELIEGVVPNLLGSPIPAASTFYLGYSAGDGAVFDDTTEGVVWSDGDGPHEHTGRLGTVFYPGATLNQYGGACDTGTGCDSASCLFPQDQLGGAASEALFVQYVFPTNTCDVP